MKIVLKNFKCWHEKELCFNDKGIILLSAKSGKGKSSILDAINFCLFGDGTKIVSQGKTSCEVMMEVDDMIITRKRRPNHLGVTNDDGYFEDDIAQTYINEKFGSLFDVVSYVKQDGFNTFLRMTPTEKLEFIEKALFQHTNLGNLKVKSREYIKECNDNLVGCVSRIETLREMIGNMIKPERVNFPLKVHPDSYEKVAKNETIKKKNSEILIKKRGTEMVELKNILNHFMMVNESKKSKLQLIQKNELLIRENEKFLQDFKDNFKGQMHLQKLKKFLDFIDNQKKLLELSNQIKEEKDLYERLKKDEENELQNSLLKLENEIWLEGNESETNELITSNKDYYKDLEKFLNYRQEALKYQDKSEEIENLKREIEDLRLELLEVEKRKNTLSQSKNIYRCPHCTKSIALQEDKVIKSDTIVIENIEKEITNIKEKEKILKNNLREKETLKNEYIKTTENYLRIDKEIQELYSSYEGLDQLVELSEIKETIKETLVEIKKYEKYLADNLKLQEKLQKIKYQQENQILSASLRTMKLNIDNNQSKLENLKKNLDKNEKDFDLNDEKEIKVEFEKQKNIQESMDKLENKNFTLLEVIENYQKEISLENENFKKKYNLDSDITVNDIEENIKTKELEIQELEEKLQKTIEILDKIDAYNNYIKNKDHYDNIEKKIEESVKEEKEFRSNLAGATMLKDKISEAESISITNFVHSLNISVNLHLEAFFKEDPMMIEIETFKEAKNNKQQNKPQINIKIDYKGMDCDLSCLSGGERDRLDLAFTLALSEIFGSRILLLDECISSLDYETSNHVLDGLRENYKGKTVIVVSHQANEGSFDEIIKF